MKEKKFDMVFSRLATNRILAVFAVAFTICMQGYAQQKSGRKPNIIYIYADDLGYGEIGPYGQKKIKTPFLDQVAAAGMKFNKHYTSTPVCAPARCMLLTGRHGGHSFIRGNYELGRFEDDKEGGQMPLPEGTLTIAKVLQQAGYKTGIVGKWGLGMTGSSGHPNRQGFDYFYGYLDQKQAHNYYPTHLWENEKWDTLDNSYIEVHKKFPANATDKDFDYYTGKEYAIDKMGEKTKQFINTHRNEPFFLYLPFTIPHVSLQIHQAEIQKYVGQFDEKPYLAEKGYVATKYPLSAYAAMISYLDTQVGAVLAQLKQLGLDENTIVLFSSDNGPSFNGGVDREFFNSSGGLRGGKMEVYEGGIRVPFLVRWPGKIKAGSVSELPSAQFDMFATFCEIAGIKAPVNDGVSLLPEMTGKGKTPSREYLYFEFPEKGGQLAIRFERYKAVKMDVKARRDGPWELYDLKEDPAETKNIAAQNPAIIEKLEGIVRKEHLAATIREWEFVDPKF